MCKYDYTKNKHNRSSYLQTAWLQLLKTTLSTQAVVEYTCECIHPLVACFINKYTKLQEILEYQLIPLKQPKGQQKSQRIMRATYILIK